MLHTLHPLHPNRINGPPPYLVHGRHELPTVVDTAEHHIALLVAHIRAKRVLGALLPGLGRVVFDGRVPLHTLVTTEFFLLGAVDIRDENRRRVLVLGPQLVIPAS